MKNHGGRSGSSAILNTPRAPGLVLCPGGCRMAPELDVAASAAAVVGRVGVARRREEPDAAGTALPRGIRPREGDEDDSRDGENAAATWRVSAFSVPL